MSFSKLGKSYLKLYFAAVFQRNDLSDPLLFVSFSSASGHFFELHHCPYLSFDGSMFSHHHATLFSCPLSPLLHLYPLNNSSVKIKTAVIEGQALK